MKKAINELKQYYLDKRSEYESKFKGRNMDHDEEYKNEILQEMRKKVIETEGLPLDYKTSPLAFLKKYVLCDLC